MEFFHNIYKSGTIPREGFKSTPMCLLKKANAKESSDHRTISFMSHTLKLFLKIFHKKISPKFVLDINKPNAV